MTTVPSSLPQAAVAEGEDRRNPWLAAAQDALRKPLTSYYLLLVSSALLLVIGLIMVLSASSVYSYRVTDGA
ncbi:MAG: cell division protein FtsW, partial [Nocardioides sp.]